MQSPEPEGVLQALNADVSDAEALILRADARVDRQTQGGTGRAKNRRVELVKQ